MNAIDAYGKASTAALRTENALLKQRVAELESKIDSFRDLLK